MHSRAPDKSRRHHLDFLRVCAMFAVIAIHCVMPITIALLPSAGDWPAAEVIDSYMRWCVPVFIMISGALLIRREVSQHIGAYFRRRASRILIPLIAWPILYAAWLAVFGKDVTWSTFSQGIFNGDPIGGSQLYFLFIIAGLYILNPLISAFATKVSSRTFFWSSIAALAGASAWHSLANLLPELDETYNMFTWCLPYIGYFMLGYALRNTWLTGRRAIGALVGFVLLGMINALLTMFTRLDGHFFFQSYLSMTVMGLSICAFLGGRALYKQLAALIQHTPWREKCAGALTHLAQVSFGVYLIHVMILETIVYVFMLDQASLQTAAILFLCVPPLSIVSVSIMIRVPFVRRLVI